MAENSGRKKIAYYSINDPLDKRSWSGITYYLGKSLEKNVGDVYFLGPVKIPWILDKFFRGIQKFTRLIFKTEWIPKYSFLKNSYAAFILKRKMKGQHYDFLFAPAAAPELACLKTKLPIVYFNDATFKAYSETYEKEFNNINKFSKWEGNKLESIALKKSSLVILTSQWAASSAVSDYKTPGNKIEVISMGANIDFVPDKYKIFDKLTNKNLTLLFLAVDWERKGGSIAFATLINLHALGIEAKLIVCGVKPPEEFKHSHMDVIPFLNKNKRDDYERFVKLLSEVHFLLVPTRADCSLLVNAEANAYGIPTISTNIGGVADVVKNGINGFCLPFTAAGSDYASIILNIFTDKEKYKNLIETSRQRFDEVLNWDSFASNFRIAMNKHQLL
ncbi:MAG: glycosyltransferase family 4 protein [Bacteroidota bacterium]|nr:glycosyltransferase family 4 protein [Bacteroidota bacterium]